MKSSIVSNEINVIAATNSHIIKDMESLRGLVGDKIETCLTGMRPSGKLHLGHYVGALDNWLTIQDMPNIACQFLIADYHVMADKEDVVKVKSDVFEVLKDWIAVGLDPVKADFVLQSYVPESTELMMFLMNLLPISRLYQNPTLKTEMTQLKDRGESITAGFFNYPVSQAADILTPKATLVPV